MNWPPSSITMNPRIPILGHRPHSRFMIGMARESIPGRLGKGISYIARGYPLSRIVWKWDPISNFIHYSASYPPKTISHSRSSKKFTSLNKPSTTPKQTTSEKSSVHKEKHKKLSKKEVAAESQFEVEVQTKSKKTSSKTFNPFTSSS